MGVGEEAGEAGDDRGSSVVTAIELVFTKRIYTARWVQLL